MLKNYFLGTLLFLLAFSSYAQVSPENLDKQINHLLSIYLKDHQQSELVTGIAASVYSPALNKNYYSGFISKEKRSAVSANTLFEIGSITKSFTSAIILQLEAEDILNINQTLGMWLPEYPKWKAVSIKRLLNMTSGIPDYLSQPLFLNTLSKNIKKQWSKKEIVDLIYKVSKSTKGFDYSNTNYLLAAMIIEKATGHTFAVEINNRLLRSYNFNKTFYADGPYSQSVMQRLAHGYYYGKKIGSIDRGADVTAANMSLAGPAGALVSTPEDVNSWANALLAGSVLPEKQKQELKEMISTKTGKAIQKTSANDPMSFALGISQETKNNHTVWNYEGDTFGYRAMYVSSLCGDMIASVTLNSSPLAPSEKFKDDINKLAFDLYAILLQANPDYHCKIE